MNSNICLSKTLKFSHNFSLKCKHSNKDKNEGLRPKSEAKLLEKRVSKINGLLRVAKLPVVVEEESVFYEELSDATVLLIGKEEDCIHSVYRPYSVITHGYWDVMSCLPALVPQNGIIGIYGLGAGTVSRLIYEYYPKQKMQGWELDPDIIDLGRKHMELSILEESGVLDVFIGDCLTQEGVPSSGFSGLMVDIFLDNETHPNLSQVEFWKQMRSRLHPEGRLIANLDPEQISLLAEAFEGELQWHKHHISENLLALTGPYPTPTQWSQLPDPLRQLGVHKNWFRGPVKPYI